MLQKLNPAKFISISRWLLPISIIATLGFLAVGLYLAFFSSPADYQQGETVRIMYVHVPSAWMSLFIYVFIAAASCGFLAWRNILLANMARAAAPIGAMFALATLVSGSLWGRPIWGTWWEWDARMTSMLILFFLYIGYISLGNAFDNQERGLKSSSVLAIIGVVNIPIIKFSVDWWNTLHQPASVLKLSGPAIDNSMLLPLLIMAFGFMFYFLTILIIRTKSAIFVQKLKRGQVVGGR